MSVIVARVISGGQTGADVAALRAAKSRGVPTGGTMPHGFRTLAGPRPKWAREFGLVEHASSAWDKRTWKNVEDADITVRVALKLHSPGECCTANACAHFGKPMVDVQLRRDGSGALVVESFGPAVFSEIAAVAHHLKREITINAAGNSETTAPGIEMYAEWLWYALLGALNS